MDAIFFVGTRTRPLSRRPATAPPAAAAAVLVTSGARLTRTSESVVMGGKLRVSPGQGLGVRVRVGGRVGVKVGVS